MLDDISAQDAACKAAVERAQDKLQRLNLDAEVAKHQTALDDLQRKASALRQVCQQTCILPCSSHYEQIATSTEPFIPYKFADEQDHASTRRSVIYPCQVSLLC